ncbi:MAG: BlaI/MecI/CopY family transcriptional regulator [Muribaculaceae bacterium]
MKRKDNTLTKVEFQIMSILWDIDRAATVWDVLERCPEPKPAYTTIATYMKVLYEKGYIDYFKVKGEGKSHRYRPKMSRIEYTRLSMQDVKNNLFGGSIGKMLCFFVKEENLSDSDIEQMLKMIDNQPYN